MSTRSAPAHSEAQNPTPEPLAPAPARASAVDDVQASPRELEAWVSDPEVEPEVRYAALRRLEQDDGDQALKVAIDLLAEQDRLIRSNAIAVLVRSDDPRADEALDALQGSNRRLALALIARR